MDIGSYELIYCQSEPLKRRNKPSLHWINSSEVISPGDYLRLEGETPPPGIGPRMQTPASNVIYPPGKWE